MKYIKILLLFILFSNILLANISPEMNASTMTDEENSETYEEECDEDGYEPLICYRFESSHFYETFETPKDIIIGTPSITDNIEYIDFRIPLTNYDPDIFPHSQSLSCSKNKVGIYECVEQDRTGGTQIYMKEGSMYLHVDYIQIDSSFEPDEANKIIHHTKSKEKTFVKGVKSPCYTSKGAIFKVKNIEKGSKKEKLLQSIDTKDVIIYDLAYQGDLVIAVGSDNAAAHRGEYIYFSDRAGYRPGIILKSIDGGDHWEKQHIDFFSPFSNVMILNDHTILAFSTGVYGESITSLDEGKTWSKANSEDAFPYIEGDIKSITHSDTTITLTNDNNMSWESKDSGGSWKELAVVEKKHTSTNTPVSKSTKSVEKNTIAVLEIPKYFVDYEHGTLSLQHDAPQCNCDDLALSLTYNQSNTKKGILGLYWSLGVESHIRIQSENDIFLFDAFTGKEAHYLRDTHSKNIFRYANKTIKRTRDGYMTTTCDTSKHYFTNDGYLTKLVYKDKSYLVTYKKQKIDQVLEIIKGASNKPYLSFQYKYEGLSIVYHAHQNKTITFLKDTEGLLYSILDGIKHIFHYKYSPSYNKNQTLIQVTSVQKEAPFSPILRFEYDGRHGGVLSEVEDLRLWKKEGKIEKEKYAYYSKGKELTCVEEAIKETYEDGHLSVVTTALNLYHFSYADKSRKHLEFTKSGSKTYGFDKEKRVNFYSQYDHNISNTYSTFSKIIHSIVTKGDQVSEYSYEYSKDTAQHLTKFIMPKDTIELKYNQKGQIIELISKEHHIIYEYLSLDKPGRIILPGKGEITMTYAANGEIKKSETKVYNKDISDFKITLSITQAMQFLLSSISLGSIKNYPDWVQ